MFRLYVLRLVKSFELKVQSVIELKKKYIIQDIGEIIQQWIIMTYLSTIKILC